MEMAEEAPQTTDSPTNSGIIAKAHAIKKLDVDPQIVKILAQSQEDYAALDARILAPPYDPLRLYSLSFTNNTLLQAISVMEVNIDGTGHQIAHRDGEEAGNEGKIAEIRGFFSETYPNRSITTIRRKLRVDMETLGYGFLEIIRNVGGQISLINHVDAAYIRLLRLGAEVDLEKSVYRNGQEVPVRIRAAERIFVKIAEKEVFRHYSKGYVPYKKYYKEFGSKRRLDADTGRWEDEQEVKNNATELLMFKVHEDSESPYGMPRWINNTPSVLGSRSAEEYNLEFFDSGGLPPVLLMLQGASLDTEARQQLLDYLAGKAKNKHRGLFLEMFSNSGDINATAKSSVTVERFGHERMADAMFMKYDESTARHVRTAFRLPDLYFGLNQNYNYACYDEDTETLTDQGWIKRSEYKEGMKVAQVDPETAEMSFVSPSGLSVYDVQDVDMYHFKNGYADICVTPKHRMLWTPSDSNKGDQSWRITPVEEMSSNVRVRATVEWPDRERLTEFHVPYVRPLNNFGAKYDMPLKLPAEDFLELLGWLVSDGHVAPKTYVGVTQKVTRYLGEIRKLAKRMPPSVHTYEIPGGASDDMVKVCFGNYSLHRWAKEAIGKGLSKRLPQWVLNLPKDQLQILFDAMMKGDGTTGPKGTSYCTISDTLKNQFQELALKLGYRTKVSISRSGSFTGGEGSPIYRIHLTRKGRTTLRTHNLERIPYSGKVHCFTVPTGVYVTRRNGCVAIQGNTAHVATMAAEAQVFRVEREEFDEMLNTTIMKEIAPDYLYKSNEITLNDVDKQLRALDLAGKQTNVSRKDLLEAISEVTHLNLEEMRDGEMPFIPPGAAQVASPPNMEGAGSQDPNATANTNAGGSHQM